MSRIRQGAGHFRTWTSAYPGKRVGQARCHAPVIAELQCSSSIRKSSSSSSSRSGSSSSSSSSRSTTGRPSAVRPSVRPSVSYYYPNGWVCVTLQPPRPRQIVRCLGMLTHARSYLNH